MNKQQTTSKELKKKFLAEEQIIVTEEPNLNAALSKKNLLDDSRIQAVIQKTKSSFSRNLISEANLPYFIEYIKAVIMAINTDKNIDELKIYGKILDHGANYCSCKVFIGFESSVKTETYDRFDMASMTFDELLGNCSTVSFHHFRNITAGYYSALFDTKEKTEKFIKCIKYYMKEILNYSSLFFTISNESDRGLAYYCEKNCKNIFEVNNKRNDHLNTYYCEKL